MPSDYKSHAASLMSSYLGPSRPANKMSLTQTYRIASTARGKLGREAARPDHNLRRLVGHANLLDGIMLDLANAEREQEDWFNETVKHAQSKRSDSPKHIQWFDNISEEEDDLPSGFSSDSSDEEEHVYEEEDEDEVYQSYPTSAQPVILSAKRSFIPPPPPAIRIDDYDQLPEMADDEDDEGDLTLSRSPRRSLSPPALVHEDEDSEDEMMPPSPTYTTANYNGATEMFAKAPVNIREAQIRDSEALLHASNAMINAF